MENAKKKEKKFITLESENNGNTYLERVTHIEKHLDSLCSVFSGYTVKCAQLRDKNDDIAKTLHKFSQEEPFETTMKLTMKFLSQIISTVGDYRDMEVERLEGKVLSSLTCYGDIFKYLKTDIRKAMGSTRKESDRRKDLERFLVKRNESKYREAIALSESALERAVTESSHLNEQIEEQMMKFEHKRLVDIKESFEQFLRVEIAVNAKLVELFTEAFQTVHAIDIDTDMEIIRAGLKLSYSPPLSKKKRRVKYTEDGNGKILTTGSFQEGRNGDLSKSKMYSPLKVLSKADEMMAPIQRKAKEIRLQNKIAKIMEENKSKSEDISIKPTSGNKIENSPSGSEVDSDLPNVVGPSSKLNYIGRENSPDANKSTEIKNSKEIAKSSYPRSNSSILQKSNKQQVDFQNQFGVQRGHARKSATLMSEIVKEEDDETDISDQLDDSYYAAIKDERERHYARSLLKKLEKEKRLRNGERSDKLNIVSKKRVSFKDSRS